MTGSALLVLAIAFAVPFAICFLLARRGHARTAWRLPGGILAMTLALVALGLWYSRELQAGLAAAASIGAISVPAILGGALGILLGRGRA